LRLDDGLLKVLRMNWRSAFLGLLLISCILLAVPSTVYVTGASTVTVTTVKTTTEYCTVTTSQTIWKTEIHTSSVTSPITVTKIEATTTTPTVTVTVDSRSITVVYVASTTTSTITVHVTARTTAKPGIIPGLFISAVGSIVIKEAAAGIAKDVFGQTVTVTLPQLVVAGAVGGAVAYGVEQAINNWGPDWLKENKLARAVISTAAGMVASTAVGIAMGDLWVPSRPVSGSFWALESSWL
jgi:hypothetical protein